MATSSSEESNSAPIDFNLSSLTGSNNGKTSIIYEKCPLCLRSRKIFYCRECIANGDIMHSKAKYPESNESNEKAISELAEAKQTNYVKGHWVSAQSSNVSNESQFSIVVEPFLRGDGDYSAYPNWIREHKDSPTIGEIEQRNPAYNIIAALTYTTQLVSILSYYLDIRLPKNLSYSEFCGHELSEQQFFHKVAKLNANVVHLCLSQNVKPDLIHPKETILNLLLLLNPKISDLGRCGPISIDEKLFTSMNGSLLKDLNLIEELDDCKNSDEENEWETVPNVAASEFFYPPPTTSYGSSPGTNSQLQPSGTTSFAGGLISAAASVASFWRAATGQK
ncbi:beclin 1-associated autophagy-related key regulator-like [Centruroides sculpturatus]|uniref:beclin 1-associated autophagy-related key regulator-like n=1 Tax=Centruroides sculpturatus TaxID=218467 RepID=UPI000C6E6A53|nr:beclin 1-associated autophagy-related key regulator-like [Centruroides sculpturatus]